ncbi:DUF479 domain-containing protein [Pseudoalteromonas ruthenica]|uniref:acyl carrier protein phosphodiesterase n=1 Tax=Pseudoalteromonas ruthenica TaxID=151081 RepID=UPI0011081BF5|nr:ACP phosphodiesterase [Pseudoalteromonas ruthenica]TLX50449.1 DUF479 domain-containing protein [Pseudoalteromonas ruthenica]
MNYLAHLFLAQNTADSHFGNLLGDFRRGVSTEQLPRPVYLGLKNHLLVDKFTDNNEQVRQAKQLFSPQRRRFAGVALDVLFDHFLIRHWSRFSSTEFANFRNHAYTLLLRRQSHMPQAMQQVVARMSDQDWFSTYAHLDGVALALDNIAKRIRFNNEFAGSINDIEQHFEQFEAVFLHFFPLLCEHVQHHAIEQGKIETKKYPSSSSGISYCK